MREWPLKMIHYLTGFIILSSIHCLFASLAAGGDKKTFIYSLIYFPIVILLSEGQKKVKYFWQFLIFAGAGAGMAYFLAGNTFDRKMGLVLAVLASASYFYARAGKKRCWLEEPVYPFLAIYIIMILLEMKYKSTLLRNYAVYGAGMYYLLCMYKNNLDEMYKIMDAGARLERFPMKRLFQGNYVMMGFQTAIVIVGMCIAGMIGVEGALYRFVQMIRDGIAKLLRGLESGEPVWGEQAAEEGMQMVAVQTQEMSRFMEILQAVGEFLGWVIAIGITLFAIFKILKKLYRLYLAFDINSEENGDQIEQLYVAGTKDEKRMMRKQRTDTSFWDRTPNTKIRRTYKKRVLRDWKEIPDAAMTPNELEEKVVMGENEKRLFHSLYEKARYGKDNCTREEVAGYRF